MEFRSYAPFAMKALGESGIFSGYASVFGIVDAHQDIIEVGAFKETLADNNHSPRVKLLWQHLPEEPIGVLTTLREDGHGLYVEGKLLLSLQRAKEAYALLNAGSIDGLSIGFSINEAFINPQTGIRHITSLWLWEVSLVTFPANPEAAISSFKRQLTLQESAHIQDLTTMIEGLIATIHTPLSF
ncbi:MAG: HK97 family phage prohead protease [Alphaproteobacteria bacterium]|nr:HK97 family phage prohead protease [Alphaproteobacteria bacterium]